mgnify:CR=1 FL=1
MNTLLLAGLLFLMALQFISLYRVVKGPSVADRLVGLQVIASKVTAMIVLIAYLTHQPSYLDVALVYAMIGFVTTLAVSKFVVRGSLR